MTACDQEQRLTPFLLGDLPAAEADAYRRHLAQCKTCQQAACELEPVVAALRSALKPDAADDLLLDPPRRAQLLAVTPAAEPAARRVPGRRFGGRVILWAARPRAWLAMAASLILIVGVVLFLIPAFMTASSKPPPRQAEMLCIDAAEPAGAAQQGKARFLAGVAATPAEGVYGLWQETAAKPAAPAPSSTAPASPEPESNPVALLAPSPKGAEQTSYYRTGRELESQAATASKSEEHLAMHSSRGSEQKAPREVATNRRLSRLQNAEADADQRQDFYVFQRQPASSGLASLSNPSDPFGNSKREDNTKEQLGDLAGKDELQDRLAASSTALNSDAAQVQHGAQASDKAQPLFDLGREEKAGEAFGIGGGSGGAIESKAMASSTPALVAGYALGTAARAEAMTSDRKTDSAGGVEMTILSGSDASRVIAARDGLKSSLGLGLAGAVAGKHAVRTAGGESEKRAFQEHMLRPQAEEPQLVAAVSPDNPEPAPELKAGVGQLMPEAPRPEQQALQEAAELAKPRKVRQRTPVSFNPFVAVTENRFSTFGISVDTASYTVLRHALLQGGTLPDPEQVRTEEVVNAFDYGDEAPAQATFRIVVEGAPTPFGAPGLATLRIGIKGRRLGREEQRPAMLTFLIDTSGSMSEPDRIGRARTALRLLLDRLAPHDRLQLIAFDDHARLVLPPTPAREKQAILAAFDHLQCNGSTNLEDGMRRAYEQAARAFVPGGENRVILVSDGVANLGSDNAQDIVQQVADFRRQGVTCSIFGVGNGTYNDAMLADLANKGGGVYRFLDTDDEVRRVFVDDLAATLNTIARDVKIQVEWSPAAVLRYRQLGYESRALQAEQFRDDRVQAGEVGSGQSVTALYQIERLPIAGELPLGTVHVRYRRTDNGMVDELSRPITAADLAPSLAAARPAFRLAVCAAAFAEVLRGNPAAGGTRFADVARLLRPVSLEMPLDTRVKELLSLVEAAAAVQGNER